MKAYISILSFLLISTLLVANGSYAQDSVRKSQLIIQLDNDAFISGRQDRYYTAGHYAAFHYYINKGRSLSLAFANQIFTPDLRKELEPEDIDRPFAGVNYFELGYQKRRQTWFFEASVLSGWIGPGSGVGQFHNWYHDSFNFPRAKGWENQIEDSFIANLNLRTIKSLFSSKNFEVLVEGKTEFGNLDQNLSIKPGFRIGTFQALENSQINGSRVGTSFRQEQYFHFGAELKRVFYNGRIDGNLISPKEVPVFESEEGYAEIFGELILNYNHFGMGYGIFYRTRENETADNQVFARITLSWLF